MIKKQIKKFLNNRDTFTRSELLNFYLKDEPQLSENTFAWRIFNLKKKGIIKEIGRGIYSLLDKNDYFFELDKKSKKIASAVLKNFSNPDFCISESSWINEFTTHQYSNNLIILEVEKDLIESVFFNIKEKLKNVFLKPNEIELERYISGINYAIIIVPLITRSPLQKSVDKKYQIPKLEKLIVDIFKKSPPYFFLTDSEIKTITTNAFSKYNINQTTLLAYAERRGKKAELKKFLRDNNLLEVVND